MNRPSIVWLQAFLAGLAFMDIPAHLGQHLYWRAAWDVLCVIVLGVGSYRAIGRNWIGR